ncbi:MAG: hypothetical protein OEX04_15785 [Acidimicrobiia bacterium]|nr:hypothetical protein [Acidimicrobiia bacterium]MDH4308928.1 hypothetical protein [Acidimicrobiia bacterium]MDH5294126.1 hypothetical protein [Acidimicrobiia bacterium]
MADQLKLPSRPVVVLDDDPTGTQTVADVPVLLTWDDESLREESQRSPCWFMLTNSRALPEPEAVALAGRIGDQIRGLGVDVAVVSRSDSTLRGHFPAEVDALGVDHDLTLLVPAFPDGGRITVDSTHYLVQNGARRPVAETEFARDPVFGYSSSYLPDWVEEKTGGRVLSSEVVRLLLDDIAAGRAPDVLANAPVGATVVADSVTDAHVEAVAAAVRIVENAGRRVLARTAASFARARMGVRRSDLLDPMVTVDGPGGLVVVGSHVATSTEQLERLLLLEGVVNIEVDVMEALSGRIDTGAIADQIDALLEAGSVAVLSTSRALVSGSLDTAKAVSGCISAIVRGVGVRPGFLVSKGGITSSDVATTGLGGRRAIVMGQVQPGVAVWRHDVSSRHPGLVQVVYPGNVGGPGDLAALVRALMGCA